MAHIAWAANLGCLDLNPWPVRRADVDHPDELRVDLDPQPGVAFDDVRRVALEARTVLEEHGLVGFPEDLGLAGHARERAHRAALDLHRGTAGRAGSGRGRSSGGMPDVATSAWWKEERGERVFIDYNQNARDRTVASAYSVRANPEGRVSCPLDWDEVPDVEPVRPDPGHGAGPVRRAGRPGRRRSTTAATTSGRCWSWRLATRPGDWATRPGHRTSPSRRASPAGSRRARPAPPEE